MHKRSAPLEGKLVINGKETHYSFLEWTDQQVIDFWNYQSRFPENYFTKQVGRQLADFIEDHIPGTSEVLDYGTGPGFLPEELMKRGYKVTGLEFANETIDHVNERLCTYDPFRGCITPDQLDSGDQFSLITLVEVIEHLNDKQLDQTFKNLRKHLSSRGKLLITTPNDEDLYKKLVFSPDTGKVFHPWQHVRSWNSHSLKTFLQNQGFTNIQTYALDLAQYKPGILKGRWRKRRLQNNRHKPHLIAIACVE